MGNMIAENEIIVCPWCNNGSTAKQWDEITYGECKSREMRRTYTSILNKKVFNRKYEVYYKCPKCSQWSRGNQLTIDSNDGELSRLGGESIIKFYSEDK